MQVGVISRDEVVERGRYVKEESGTACAPKGRRRQ
jgi:hypothetical protein